MPHLFVGILRPSPLLSCLSSETREIFSFSLILNKLINQSDERIGDTNRFNQEFEIAVNYNEQKEYEYQLFEPLELISFIPSGNYTAQIPVLGDIYGETYSEVYN